MSSVKELKRKTEKSYDPRDPFGGDQEFTQHDHSHAAFAASESNVFTVGGYIGKTQNKESNKAELRTATSLNQYEGEWDEVATYPLRDNIFYNFIVSVSIVSFWRLNHKFTGLHQSNVRSSRSD